jgi:NhaC family Na+:H+ antiporter
MEFLTVDKKKPIPIWVALIPFLFLILALTINVVFLFGDDSLSGSNQLIILLATAIAAILGIQFGSSWEEIRGGIAHSVGEATQAIFILLMIGALAGTWLISGVIPAMIYYGLQILQPSYFLVASVVVSAIVALATGSSWSTAATVGIALIGIGNAMEIPEAYTAGAVISGAYFGDKLSPLSDTTNLAPIMAGTDLFTHIRYLLYTTVPTMIITLILFGIIGLKLKASGEMANVSVVQEAIKTHFNISLWLFLVPALVIGLILKKVQALPALLAGTLAGALAAFIAQPELLGLLGGSGPFFKSGFIAVINAMTIETRIEGADPVIQDLLVSGGMSGMLNTIWLVLAAMAFGGTMEVTGFLHSISNALLRYVKSTFSLIAATGSTSLLVNISASDQYLSIVIPGKMYKDIYQKKGLAPENLSRTLEDMGTVTSVLVPWNTCGAYQAGVLGVATWTYLPFAFFNWISPIMTLLFAAFQIKIRKLDTPKNS